MINKYIIAILIFVFLFLFSYGVTAMSVKQCLFSEMTGVINFEGKPAAGVKLVRTVDYDKPQHDETVTDINGNFHFPAIFRHNIAGMFLPMQFVVGQQITAYKDDVEYFVWGASPMDSTANYEARGNPLVVSCELSLEEEIIIAINNNVIVSRCTWDVEPDPDDDASINSDKNENPNELRKF